MKPVPIFLLALFGAACLALIVPALRRRSGVLEFPFLAGCGLLGFLFPQAIGIVRNDYMVPADGLVDALLMCILSAIAVYAGWHEPAPARWRAARRSEYPVRRLYWIGAAALAIGLAGFLKLASLSGGIAGHYSVRGNYSLDWRGLPVVYDFFAQYLVPGLALCGLTALLLRSKARLIPPAAALTIQLAAIVFLGRRSVLISVLTCCGCILYFGKRWLPSRRVVFCAAPLIALAMFLAPEYRTHSQIGADRDRLASLDVRKTIGALTEGGQHEFWALANYIHFTSEDNLYEYGAGIYNTFVQLFVPKLLVGERVKAGMFIGLREPDQGGWQMPYGMVPTGPGSAFRQFWFFGCLWFYALSRVMRYLWLRATAGRDLVAQVCYTFLLTPAVASVVNDMYGIYPPVFMFWLPLVILTSNLFAGGARNLRSNVLPQPIGVTN